MKFGSLLTAGAALLLSDFAAAQGQTHLLANYPQTTGLQTGWKYLGCYSDRRSTDVGDRALGGYFRLANPQGGNQCITVCLGINPNFKYAGTDDNQCWCDTGLNNNGTAQYGQKLAESYCDYGCRGSTATNKQTCGNPNTGLTLLTGPAVSVYTNDQGKKDWRIRPGLDELDGRKIGWTGKEDQGGERAAAGWTSWGS
ncbi:hypothetical protein DM02DRAFT_662613 [Periconia macrospinosa]|uniref:WSC domain-containing protein n=1 Tax=Periconia macrospinosa TaxID=97972 RepID=A0A2V1D462_9PLEO|nr:hypothetical protein DM02DRAFT_662613 [Periconia macrospinosa]